MPSSSTLTLRAPDGSTREIRPGDPLRSLTDPDHVRFVRREGDFVIVASGPPGDERHEYRHLVQIDLV
jgi:hypothetical protein